MPLASWLFVRDGKSIWVERPHGHALIVAGPGPTREQHEFPDERALDAFQAALAERLANAGWFLWGINRDRRAERDRRSVARADDRWRPLPALR